MPVPPAKFNPQFSQFQQVAEQAVKQGGAVRVDKSGTFSVEGTTWLGRKVMWLKTHVMPNKTRAQNQHVLRAVIRSLKGRGMDNEELTHTLMAMGGQAMRRRDISPAAFTQSLKDAAHNLSLALQHNQPAPAEQEPVEQEEPAKQKPAEQEPVKQQSADGKNIKQQSKLRPPREGGENIAAANLRIARKRLLRQKRNVPPPRNDLPEGTKNIASRPRPLASIPEDETGTPNLKELALARAENFFENYMFGLQSSHPRGMSQAYTGKGRQFLESAALGEEGRSRLVQRTQENYSKAVRRFFQHRDLGGRGKIPGAPANSRSVYDKQGLFTLNFMEQILIATVRKEAHAQGWRLPNLPPPQSNTQKAAQNWLLGKIAGRRTQ